MDAMSMLRNIEKRSEVPERNKDTCGNLTAVCKATCMLNTICVESKDVVLALSHVKDAVDRGVQ